MQNFSSGNPGGLLHHFLSQLTLNDFNMDEIAPTMRFCNLRDISINLMKTDIGQSKYRN